MIDKDIGKLLLGLALPCTVGLLIISVYSFADAYFVSKLGATEIERTANIGVVGSIFPVISLAQAIGYTLGIGGGCTVSRLLGRGEQEKASSAVSFAIGASFLLGLVIALIGIIFPARVFDILKVREEWRYLAKEYSFFVFLSVPFSVSVIAMSSLLRAEGKTFLAMVGLAVAGGLDLFLTPMFLFRLKLGLYGASLATAISQGAAFLVLLYFYLKKRTSASFLLRRVFSQKDIIRTVLAMGIPSLFRQGFVFVSNLILNRRAISYGGDVVAAVSIVSRTVTVLISIPIGIGQGYQPIVGYNDSAGRSDRVKQAFRVSLIAGFAILIPISLILYCVSPYFFSAFLEKKEALDVAVSMFRFQVAVLPLLPLNTIVNMSYQATGKKWRAVVLASLRQGVLFLPILYISIHFWGLSGLKLAQAAADLATFAVSIPFAISIRRNLQRQIVTK